MRFTLFVLSFLPISFFGADKPDKYPSIDKQFDLKVTLYETEKNSVEYTGLS